MQTEHFRVALRDAVTSSIDGKVDDDTSPRIKSFVEAVDDVPGITARARGPNDWARVEVEDDYGNRDEYGTGNVVVARESTDPVGKQAFDHGLTIVRTSPNDGFVEYWFAAIEDVVDAYDDAGGE